MILLDSDHLSVLRFRSSPRARELTERLAAESTPIGTTIVNVEETMRGWLSSIAKERHAVRQVAAYRELAELFTFFAAFHVALFEEQAAAKFDELRGQKIRIGTSDLKTAAVAVTNDALLLTANRRDFEQVPGLRFANWLAL